MLTFSSIAEWIKKTRNRCVSRRLCLFTGVLTYTLLESSLLWPSPSIPKLLSDDSPIPTTPTDADHINLVLTVGSFISLIIVGGLVNISGRRPLLLAGATCSLVGWLIISLATNVPELLAARFIIGLGTGIVRTTVPLYLAEIATPKERGVSFAAIMVFIIPANILQYIIGPLISFRLLAWISSIIPVVYFALVLLIVESPYYFLIKDNQEAAMETLKVLRKDDNIAEEFEEIKDYLKKMPQIPYSKQITMIFTEWYHFKGVALMSMMNILVESSGSMAILSLVQPVLLGSGVNISMFICGIMITVALSIAGPVLVYCTKRFGTKSMLFLSSVGTTCMLVVFGLFLYIKETRNDAPQWLPLAIVVIYFIFVGFGLNLFLQLFVAEVLHPHVKAAGFIISYAFATLAQILAMHILSTASLKFSFTYFSVSALLFSIGVYFLLPETKDKSLRTVQNEMSESNATP